ncbi:MAG: hypothetical protein KGQ61_13210, partial [Planctomycetes bacterium]|nr:hypothetical protein [Planctomycetota bacterium]
MPSTEFLSRIGSAVVVGTSLLASSLFAVATPAKATTVTFTEAGFSFAGTPLLVSAQLDTAADAGGDNYALKITLRSYGAPTKFAADVLTSFYFNIADPNSGVRPNLTYISGTGQAYEVRSTGTDAAVSWAPNLAISGSSGTWTTSEPGALDASNLVAINDFNEGWQFKTLSPPPAYPGLGFGIGTVGNSDLWKFIPGGSPGDPEGFDGKVIRGTHPGSALNLGIYSVGAGTDITP